MPRELLKAAKVFAENSAASFDTLKRPNAWNNDEFNHSEYNEIACCILEHAKSHQTSHALANYILKVVNISSIKSVLVLGEHPNFDYMVLLDYILIKFISE